MTHHFVWCKSLQSGTAVDCDCEAARKSIATINDGLTSDKMLDGMMRQWREACAWYRRQDRMKWKWVYDLAACLHDCVTQIRNNRSELAYFRKFRDELQGENTKLVRENRALRAENAAAKEALDSMCQQFAYDTTTSNGPAIYTGGLGALEEAFEVLGWAEPHLLDGAKCQTDGCNKRATCGTPTPDGYKRLCGDHYQVEKKETSDDKK